MISENVGIAIIAALSAAIPAILGTWAALHQDIRKRKAEAREQGQQAAVKITEDFVTARQAELDAMTERRKALDERERWFNAEVQRLIQDGQRRLDDLEERTEQQQVELRKLDAEKQQLIQEVDRMSNLLTQLKLENDALKRENRRIPELEARIAELERKERRAHGGETP